MLTIASVMALSAMQSALVDERLAGNLVAMARAQMAAEEGAAERLVVGPERSDAPDCEVVEQALEEGDGPLVESSQVIIGELPLVGYYSGSCWWQGGVGQWVLGWVGNGDRLVARHLILLLPEPEPAMASSTTTPSSSSPSMVWLDGGAGH
ncbi:hypothetical protein BJB45_00850 [Halomonas huangheensis]|uniref:Type 4 fimbrial biogenesis protein PilX N-terminal domain-containing protein n=2 Tax=Halomonas huangheensis TaxID=1178482 RepID=W1N2I6_9GAMM|nr:hypothetical protein AR456_02410 [Halomonas huangheensis]ERL49699.1 hypothetical protein BJB45_00850 [Halomonas huangheensis]